MPSSFLVTARRWRHHNDPPHDRVGLAATGPSLTVGFSATGPALTASSTYAPLSEANSSMIEASPRESETCLLDQSSRDNFGEADNLEMEMTEGHATLPLRSCVRSPTSTAREEKKILHKLQHLEKRQYTLLERLQELEVTFTRRRRPIEEELSRIQRELEVETSHLDRVQNPHIEPPPGPRSLMWVEGDCFQAMCMMIIMANFLVMIIEMKNDRPTKRFDSLWYLDQGFLIWYVVEVSLKAMLHQHNWLCGAFNSDRVFRWMDVVIVSGGIIEQWIMPIMNSEGGFGLPFSPKCLRLLRLFRVTRVFRILKGIYLMTLMDLSWIDGRKFQVFITMVILANAVVMGLELDFEWEGFYWMNLSFLLIFLLEVCVRLKRHNMKFFNGSSWMWNRLDFFIVTCGVVETFALPAYETLFYMVAGSEPIYTPDSVLLSLLRIFRLLRVVRLYRVLTSVKALRNLVLGIADAMHGTIWVIILTFLVLYIFAIIFTTLVGRGLVLNRDDHAEAAQTFGSVEMSMYMLFKLMNDDQSVVMFSDSVWVKLLFMLSMVVLNWVMLATLTSVVTDHMNSATSRTEREEELKAERDRQRRCEVRLINLFKEVDKDGSGFIDDEEFHSMMEEPNLRQELCESSGLTSRDLVELFDYLSHDSEGTEGTGREERRVILYEDFVNKLKSESKPASERTVFRLEEELRAAERRNVKRFENLIRLMKEPIANRTTVQTTAVPMPGPHAPRWEAKAKTICAAEHEHDLELRRMGRQGSMDTHTEGAVEIDVSAMISSLTERMSTRSGTPDEGSPVSHRSSERRRTAT